MAAQAIGAPAPRVSSLITHDMDRDAWCDPFTDELLRLRPHIVTTPRH
jgi:hypothetical protein